MGTEAPVLGTLPALTLMCLLIWLFIGILYQIIYSKLVNICKYFSEFCEPL